MEQWKDVPGWEGLYQASTLGRIRSYNRLVKTKKEGVYKTFKGIIHKQFISKGYYSVILQLPGYKKTLRVNRLVAQTFIPNPENKEIVNHIDCNPFNNKVDNLEWTTVLGNVHHAMKHGRRFHPGFGGDHHNAKPILQFKDGELIKRWPSAADVERELGIDRSAIGQAARKIFKNYHGFQWEFAS